MTYRTCKTCKEIKLLDEFYKHSQSEGGYLKKCKVCRDSYVKTWVSKNHERKKQINRESAKRKADPAKRAKSFNKWYKTTAKKNGGYARMLKRNCERTRIVKQAKPKWANDSLIQEIYDLAVSHTEYTGVQWHVDHIVPLKSDLVCGLHVESNLRVISGQENMSKKNYYWPDMTEKENAVTY